MYAIEQTIINYRTGEQRKPLIKKRWKTFNGAEKAAQTYYRWICRPCGGAASEESDAVVIKLDEAARP